MNDVLIVLNPRRIPEALASIRSLRIDKVWVRNLWTFEVEERWLEILSAGSAYEWAWLVCDDVVYSQAALDAVRELANEGHPVVTGYCNLDTSGDERVALTRSPLGPKSEVSAYDFYTRAEVTSCDQRTVPTMFAPYCLTGMTFEMWQRYPFINEPEGNAADFNLAKRLEADGVPIVAHRDAFCWHLKPDWMGPSTSQLLNGTEPAAIELELLEAPPSRS